MSTDSELLRQYADQGDEAAFAEVVRRQADLVYSVALRVTANAALAEEAMQTVFTLLARRAAALSHYDTLVGWLHTTARHTAINLVRGEVRRRAREQEAATMQDTTTTPEVNWTEIGPLLDEAVGGLREDDRKAVLLRFFKNQSHQEVGAALGLSEDTARKRVERALEKLRGYFAKCGVTASAALLATAMSANSVQAAPVNLASNVTTAALAGVGGTSTVGAFLALALTFIMTTKAKTILALAVVLAIGSILTIQAHRRNESPASNPASRVQPTAANLPTVASITKTGSAQVAAPIVAPASPSASSPSAATDVVWNGAFSASSPPPNADLNTTIPTMISYLKNDDFVHLIPFAMTPSEIKQALDSGQAISMEDLASKLKTKVLAHVGDTDMLVKALSKIQDQTPSIDLSGNKAVYEIDPSVPGSDQIIFLKKDGLWYLY